MERLLLKIETLSRGGATDTYYATQIDENFLLESRLVDISQYK